MVIEHIEYPELQKEIKEDMEAKSIRLDVYVKGSKDIIYNIEMQASNTKELPKRSRYYQGMIDLQLIDKGDKSYNKLNRTYIIFICTFDLYNQGRHIYTLIIQRKAFYYAVCPVGIPLKISAERSHLLLWEMKRRRFS